ncbi:TPA: hypothetical protein ACG3ZG_003045 [Yersinia enterocolitica]|uniref:hypothetical protein n=1 Tax=Yersinia enterocolitica TaxID=630 RepID=UPI0029726F50|nr:hypothetical protein [Yersinia enterocolitica]EKN6229521.1 hypothetical protein [Yersinia enterocolitica]HDL6651601.1 hypothetical protein [Yersinia enterocolitica]HDL8436890.1 hypothetical protein [Yersinia enterocolitica]HEF9706124.1 hypothetical protein [Yersinia enterocolitica]
MSVNIQAAVLTNLVRWKSDVQSMKKVRDDMKRLKKEAAGVLDNSITPRSAANSVKMAKQSAQAQIKAVQKVYGSAGVKGGLGTGMLGKPSKDWLQTSLAQTQAMEQTGKAQQAQTQAAKESALAEKRKVQAKKQSELALKREINGTMKLRDATFTISRMENLSVGARYKAIQQAKLLSQEYKKSNLDLSEMNQQMKFLIANTRRAEAQARRLKRETAKTARAEGRKGGGALLGVGLGGMAMAAGVGGAYAAYSSASSSVDRAKEINKLTKAGADSYEAQALQRLIQTKGIDANLENVFQDLQEKLGELVSQGTIDRRSGKIKGGGELSDVASDLFLPLGYTLKDIAKMSSSEFIVQMQLNGKALKKSAAEMRYYEETVNDLSRVSGLFADNGKEVIDTIGQMMDSGQMLNEEQLASLTRLREWGLAVKEASQTLSDKFSIALSNAMGGTDGLAEAMRQLTPLVEALGQAVAHIIKLTGFSVNQLAEPKTKAQLFQSVKEPEKRLNSNSSLIMGLSAWELLKNQFKDSKSAMVPTPQAMLSPTPYQPSSAYAAPKQTINVMPAPVQLNIDSNKLEGVFSVLADNKIASYDERQMNDLMTSYPAR